MSRCANCGGDANRRCAQCKTVVYCDVSCQREHWRKGHREICQRIGRLAAMCRGLGEGSMEPQDINENIARTDIDLLRDYFESDSADDRDKYLRDVFVLRGQRVDNCVMGVAERFPELDGITRAGFSLPSRPGWTEEGLAEVAQVIAHCLSLTVPSEEEKRMVHNVVDAIWRILHASVQGSDAFAGVRQHYKNALTEEDIAHFEQYFPTIGRALRAVGTGEYGGQVINFVEKWSTLFEEDDVEKRYGALLGTVLI